MHSYAVIDFETTGLSPGADRSIEVGDYFRRPEFQ
jgi:DNA polymerase III epsilon subunit-like protein